MLKQIKTLGIALVIGSMLVGCENSQNDITDLDIEDTKPVVEEQVEEAKEIDKEEQERKEKEEAEKKAKEEQERKEKEAEEQAKKEKEEAEKKAKEEQERKEKEAEEQAAMDEYLRLMTIKCESVNKAYIAQYGKEAFKQRMDIFSMCSSYIFDIEELAIKDAERFNKEHKNSKEYPIVSQLHTYGQYQTDETELAEMFNFAELTTEERDVIKFIFRYFFKENIDARACLVTCNECDKYFILDKKQVIFNGQPHCGCKEELNLTKLTTEEIVEAITDEPQLGDWYDGIEEETDDTVTIRMTSMGSVAYMKFDLNTRTAEILK